MTHLPHEQRVIDEHQELHEKLSRLSVFLNTDTCMTLPFEERSLLVRQRKAMEEYAEVLADRINRFIERHE